MIIMSTVKQSSERELRPLAEDSRFAAAASYDCQSVLALQEVTQAPSVSEFLVAPRLPHALAVSRGGATSKSDFKSLKIMAQDVLLPSVSTIWPSTKPYVAGIQAIWAGQEFWDAIADEEVDSTQRTIKGLRATQKAVNALLTYQGAPLYASNSNVIAGFLLATADKLYVVGDDGGSQSTSAVKAV